MQPPTRLTADHDLTDFHCGYPELDDWLSNRALRAEKQGTAATYVLTAENLVIAYYSLSAHSIVRSEIGGGWLARNTPEAVPAILLGILAVDEAHKGRGIGSSMLGHAIHQAYLACELIGLRALVVDPIDQAAANFYSRYGFKPFPARPDRLFLPLTPRTRTS
jgi:GNAT superfamily N-acetyltransferase